MATRYQRVIRSRKSKDRQHNGQKFENTKEVIRSRKSKDRQHNGQKFENTKEVIRSVNQRIENTMGKSLKVPKGNQKPYIQGQTTQWPQDIKG